MLVDMANDELDDPGDVAPGVTLGEADHVELLVRKRTNQRAEVLGSHPEEAQRVVPWRQAQSTAPTPIELVSDLPVEGERILADQDLLDPAARTHDALPDVVSNVAHRPPLAAAWQSPLLVSETPQKSLERPEPFQERVSERRCAITHRHELIATPRVFHRAAEW